ncbi:mucin-16 [Rhynchonycteris naso]
MLLPAEINDLSPFSTAVPWNAVVLAQTSDQVISGATRQSTHNFSFPGSHTVSAGFETESESSMTTVPRETSTSQPLGSAMETITSSSEVPPEDATDIPRSEDSSFSFETESASSLTPGQRKTSTSQPMRSATGTITGSSQVPPEGVTDIPKMENTSSRRFETESATSMTPITRESSTSQPLGSAMETITSSSKVPPEVPPEGATYMPRIEDSSSRTSFSVPAFSTVTPDVTSATTKLSTSSTVREPAERTLTTPTGFETESASSMNPRLKESSTSQPLGSAMETITSSSEVPHEGVTDMPKVEETSSRQTFYSGPATFMDRTGGEDLHHTFSFHWGCISEHHFPENFTHGLAKSDNLGYDSTFNPHRGDSSHDQRSRGCFETESASSSISRQRETSTSQPMRSATETITGSSQVPPEGVTDIPRIEDSSIRTSLSSPVYSMVTSDIPTAMAWLSTSSAKTEPVERVLTTPTGFEMESTSSTTTRLWETSNFPPLGSATETITGSSKVPPEGATYMSRIEDSSSRTSFSVPAFSTVTPDVTSATTKLSTSSTVREPAERALTTPTGLNTESESSMTPGTGKTSTSQLLGSAKETFTPSSEVLLEDATDIPRTEESAFSFDTESASSMNPRLKESSTSQPLGSAMETITSSSEVPHEGFETKSASSVTPGMRETSTSQLLGSATETIITSSEVLTKDATDMPSTKDSSFSRMPYSVPVFFTVTPHMPKATPRLPTSSTRTEPFERTLTMPTGPFAAISRGTPLLDTSSMASPPASPSAVTPSFTHAEVTALMSIGFETESASSMNPRLKESSTSQPLGSAMETITGSSEVPHEGFETKSASFVTPGMRETSTRQLLGSATETIITSSEVLTRDVTDMPRTQGSSFSRMPYSVPAFFTVTPQMPKDGACREYCHHAYRSPWCYITATAWLSTSSTRTELAEMTLTMPTGQPEATSQDTTFLYTSTMASHPETPSAVTPSFTHAEVTILMESGPTSLSSMTSLPETGLLSSPHMLGISLGPRVQFLPTVRDSTVIDTLATSEASTVTRASFLPTNTAVTKIRPSSSWHKLDPLVSISSDSSQVAFPLATSSSMEWTPVSTPVPLSFSTSTLQTMPLLPLTSRSNLIVTALKFSPAPSPDVPSPSLSPHLLKNPSTADTDILSSVGTMSDDSLIPSSSEAMVSSVSTGVSCANSGGCSLSPFSQTEPGSGYASLSTTARSLPSSASTSFSSTFTTTDSSTSQDFHGITYPPTSSNTVETTLGAESSTTDGPLVVVSNQGSWTQTVRTSLLPVMDTRITENVDFGTMTSVSQVSPHSTQFIRLATGGTERAQTTTPVTLTTSISASTSGMLTPLKTSGETASTSTTRFIVTTPDVFPDVPEMTASLATNPGEETSTAVSKATPSIFSRSSVSTTTLVFSSGAETSTAIPALTVSFGEPETTTTSWVSHLVETSPTVSKATLNVSHSESDNTPVTATNSADEVSLAFPTTTVSPGVLGKMTSLVTSLGTETSMFIPMLTDSPDELETTASTAQSSSSVVISIVSPRTPGLVTSRDASSGAENNPAVQILTESPGEPDTTVSLVTHPEAQTNSVISTLTFPPAESGLMISQATSSSAETSIAFPTLTDSPHKPETAASWVTHPRTKASSTVPIMTLSPREPDTTASWVHSSNTSTPISRKNLNFSHSELDTISSTATSPGAGVNSAIPMTTVSPDVPAMVTSSVTSSGTGTSTTFSTLTESLHESDTKVSLVIYPEESSPTLPRTTPSVSHSDVDSTPSVAISLGTESSSAVPNVPITPGVPNMVTSQITSPGTDVSMVIPPLTLSATEPAPTTSYVTHSGAQTSSAVLTMTGSPEVSGVASSLVTSSGTETNTTFPTMTDFPHEPETTASWFNHFETEASSAILTLTVSPGESDTRIPLVTHSANTSPIFPKTMPSVSHSESDSTTSMATSPEVETSSTVPAKTAQPVAPGMVTSQTTGSGAEISTTFSTLTNSQVHLETTDLWVTQFQTEAGSVPTLSVSIGAPDTTDSMATHPSETNPIVSQTTFTVSHSELDHTVSTAMSPAAESSSTVLARTISPGVPGVVTSQAISSREETSTTFPILTTSSDQLETRPSWIIHHGIETSSAVPTLTDSSSEPDTTVLLVSHPAETNPTVSKTMLSFSYSVLDSIPSPVTSLGTDARTAIPSLTLSPGERKTTASLATHSEVQSGSATSPPPVSPTVPGLVTSLVTSSEAETNTTIPTLTDSPHMPETTASWVTHSRTEASSIVPTFTISPGETGTTASWVHSSGTTTPVSRTTPNSSHSDSASTPSIAVSPRAEAGSVISTTAISPGVSGIVTSLIASSRAETSTTFPTLTDALHEPETTALQSNHSETEASSIVLTMTVSPSGADTTVSLVTHSAETSLTVPKTTPSVFLSESEPTPSVATDFGTEVSSALSTLTVSPGVSDEVTSQVTISETDASLAMPTLTLSSGEPATTLLVTRHSAETSINFPASTVFLHLPDITASPSIPPGLDISMDLPAKTVSLGPPPKTSSLFTTLVNEASRVDLHPTVLLSVPVETASLATHPGTDLSATISPSALSHGLSETTGFLATSPASGTSTEGPALTASPGVLEPASTHANTGELFTATSWNTHTSQPATSVGLPEFSKTVTQGTVTSTAPKINHEESSPTTLLITTTLATTKLAARGSGPTVAEATSTFSTLSERSFVPVTTPEMSTLAYVSVTSGTTAGPFLMPFTVNFTITNLRYREDMGNLGSEIFNTTERHLQQLLGPLFKNSSISSLYTGCRLTLLRAEKEGTSTAVGAICTHHPDPTGSQLDREQLYWELSRQTHAITQLGPYTLDRNSLFVNGYNHQYWIPTTSTLVTSTFPPEPAASLSPTPSSPAAAPVAFTLNFTITNMLYTPDMKPPGSAKFNATERALTRLLGLLFENTSIGPLYSGCRLALLRPEENGMTTGIDSVCTYRSDNMGPKLDREQLYWEMSQGTHGVTRLDTYTLDRDSLYVNGFSHQTSASTPHATVTSTLFPRTSPVPAHFSSSTAAVSFLVPFTLNFTTTNLKFEEDMQQPGSRKFNTTERILQRLLKSVFKNSHLKLLYAGCRLASLSPEKDKTATKVDVICTHRSDPEAPGLDREQLYWELRQLTHGVTVLGPYMLDRDSLYVNGFTHWSSTLITGTPGTSTVELGNSGTLSSFSSPTEAAGWTKQSLSRLRIGPLICLPFAATIPTLVQFSLNFTITNLPYVSEMGHPGSAKLNTTEEVLQSILGSLFKNTSIGPLYSNCRLTSLRPEKDGWATRVDAICTYHSAPASARLDREQLYRELSHETHNVTRLGSFTLDRNSLYVNGYTHWALTSTPSVTVASTISPATSATPGPVSIATVPAPVPFTLNFTITNLHYEEDMGHLGSWQFNTTERVLQKLLRILFKNSSVRPLYLGCRLTMLRPRKDGTATGADIVCTHHPDPAGAGLDRERLYWELSQLTRGVTQLGPYTLDQDSLYINGYTHHTWATTPSMSMVATDSARITTPFSNPTAAGPALVPFTLNFTITNLRHTKDMRPGSAKFNSTESVLQYLLQPLFTNSSIGSLYAGCRLTTLRSEKGGAATGVDAICTHHSDPSGFMLDREQLYWELSHQTHGVTRLGSYILDRDHLYVNGYSRTALTSTPHVFVTSTLSLGTSVDPTSFSSSTVSGPALVTFTLNFTITNLHYMKDMQPPGSIKFNKIEKILQLLLRPLFKNTSISLLYSSCRLALLRPERGGAATSVGTVCTHRPDPAGSGPDRKQLYQELSQLTQGVTLLGPYTLDQDSLYVSGYTQHASETTPSTTGPPLVPFTLNLTITNLHYMENMWPPGSLKFNSTEKLLQRLLKPLFENTSVGPLYSGCRLTLLRPRKDRTATGADIVCTHHPDPAGPGLDRERLYWELSQLTRGVTQLGPYTLDQDSFYVNGYTNQTHTTTPSSEYLRCRRLYTPNEEVPSQALGLFLPSFCDASVYLNGYTHLTSATIASAHFGFYFWIFPSVPVTSRYFTSLAPPTSSRPTATGPTLVFFTLNFTITNMHYTEDMGHPASLKFNSTERILQRQLRLLISKTSVGPLSSGCRLASLRLEKHGAATGVDLVCTYHYDLAGPGLDREQLYQELSHETHGVTRLGLFTLDKDSLHVNGYPSGATALTPTTAEVNEEPFTLNFTINNLRYSTDMGHPGSLKFNITDTLMQHLLSLLFRRSSLGPWYAGCKVTSLRSVKNGAKTRVNFLCTYRQPPRSPGLSTKQVFRELSWQTHGITRLGPYSLDKDSLYLNGYNERGPDEPPTTPEPTTTFLPTLSSPVQPEATTALLHNLETLTLNFTISNLQYSTDMSNGSATFNSTERVLQHLLRSLFEKSSLGPYYSGCKLISLRPEKERAATNVDVVCTYHTDPLDHRLDRERLYWQLSQLTHSVTQMGPYILVTDSLFVNGYAPQSSSIQTEYQLNFRIINWNLSNLDPTSSEYSALLRDIQDKVAKLYRDSQLRDMFHSCLVTDLKLGSMSVTIRELFSSRTEASMVKQVFLDKTLNASSHWLGATYHLADIKVTEVETSVHQLTDKPTSGPSPQHFQLNFTVTNLPYVQDIGQPGTTEHQQNKRSVENALNQLFRNSSIKSSFSDCQVLAFRSVPHRSHTRVDSLCHFLPLAQRVDRVAIYEEFLQLTQNGTQLQNFTLDRDSVLVDGYSPNRHDALTENPDLPFWAIILICLVGLLVLITCLICCLLVSKKVTLVLLLLGCKSSLYIVMHCITTFWSTMGHIYNGCPIRL